MLWEALAAGHPFWGVPIGQMTAAIQAGAPPLGTHRPDLPDRLVAAVERALQLNPRKRPSASRLAVELRDAVRDRRRSRSRRPPRDRVAAAARALPVERIAGAGVAGLAAIAGAALLPFYPPGLVAALGLLAAGTSLAAPRLGLAVALFAPVLPLGNLALGAALAYAAVAGALLVAGWRDPRGGLAFAVGPVLAPLGLLALVPLAMQPVRGAWRRALHAALAVGAAAVAAGLRGATLPLGAGDPGDLGLAATESPGAVAQALLQTLSERPELIVAALALAAAAALLPAARARGPWWIAGLAAALLITLLLGAPDAAALGVVAAVWALATACAVLTIRADRGSSI
jgi:hypothetical protein